VHLTVLQDRRTLALHAAWQHGNVVRLNEVERLLPAAAASAER